MRRRSPFDVAFARDLAAMLLTFPDVVRIAPLPDREVALTRRHLGPSLTSVLATVHGHPSDLSLALNGRRFAFEPVTDEKGHSQTRWIGSPTHIGIVVPMQPLPISLFVSRRRHLCEVPRVKTGDSTFDRKHFTHADPPELALSFLDDATRATLLPLGRGLPDPVFDFKEDRAIVRFPCARKWTSLSKPALTPFEVRQAVEQAFQLADRLSAKFAELYAQMELRLGPQGAAAWARELVSSRREARRHVARRVLIALGIGLVFVAALFVVALALFLGRGFLSR